MDHSHMSHAGMDHGGMDMGGDHCNMNMLFTWDTSNLCIVFRWWHVRGTASLLMSLVAVICVTAAYEALRAGSRRYERLLLKSQSDVPNAALTETTPFLAIGRNQTNVSQRAHVIKAALYAVQTFYALMLMLLFMTYNGWVMFSMGIGAFVGYLMFGNDTSATKDGACH